MWSGWRLTKIQTTSRPDHEWPDAWTRIGKAAQRREKQEWAIEKPILEHARKNESGYSTSDSVKVRVTAHNFDKVLKHSNTFISNFFM